jgi:hypothetical protein
MATCAARGLPSTMIWPLLGGISRHKKSTDPKTVTMKNDCIMIRKMLKAAKKRILKASGMVAKVT